MLRKLGAYIIPGLDYISCIDGHIKLQIYDIEIYGAIVAYSGYIPLIHVGESTATAVSVAKMKFETIEVVVIQPQYLWADRDTETSLIMNADWQLLQK